MSEIITTQSILEKILIEENAPWQSVVQTAEHIYIKGETTWREDPKSSLFTLSLGLGRDIPEDNEYVSNIPSHPDSVFKHPCGIFLLDITEQQAKEIQTQYGVICQSKNNLNDKLVDPLSEPNFSFDENEEGNWELVLKEVCRLPSNALVINDRNLFRNNKRRPSDEGNFVEENIGVTNIIDLLKSILPKEFKSIYQVLILCEGKAFPYGIDFQKISNQLNRRKKELNRDYQIEIEIVTINKEYGYLHKLTHNRYLFSNYFTVKFDHKIAAFYEGKSTCEQCISLTKPFCDKVGKKLQDTKIRKDYPQIISEYTDENNNCVFDYSHNGNSKASILDLKNRLLKT